jgi:hypothetical protein
MKKAHLDTIKYFLHTEQDSFYTYPNYYDIDRAEVRFPSIMLSDDEEVITHCHYIGDKFVYRKKPKEYLRFIITVWSVDNDKFTYPYVIALDSGIASRMYLSDMPAFVSSGSNEVIKLHLTKSDKWRITAVKK